MTITSTEPYTAATTAARQATERGVDAFKKGAKSLTEQTTNAAASLPTVDLTKPVARYFDYIQKSIDLNREFATRWAELVTSFSGLVREQAETAGHVVREQTDAVADLTVEQAAKADELAREQAEKAEQVQREQAEQAEQAKRDEEKAAKAAERAEAKRAKEQAREPYEGLTKAELADKLAERDLPKSGTVEELIERLVDADNQ
ncbi:SAP domain-containing protein [Nakamurella multipartita]|jgi:hypothetical protein|uniref:DNA-binding SAP domain protein n=1 Tax=Nakamurella multipartita (strain ATCC 700099 / DSM 44233 / CIP 104796 / JCM 9543 / NBRC 105858 / Y-104) TaxID=479431 RepID=C8X604_NAKMY|nr:SAP domain-containing protein [Nakamurella multipartita]ACV76775.1 DNA-binding SAP domain protein [Nakamurella multipartita DSM 44233]HOZ57623.1 SAP domain-containing protein [Nakamurella multipartita]